MLVKTNSNWKAGNTSLGVSIYSESEYEVIGVVETKTFDSYVVSDDETKYPDGAVHTDGYYYERVSEGITPQMFGCTKMAVDKYTFASKSALNVGIPHSLGEIPKYVFIFSEVDEPTSTSSAYLTKYWGAMPVNSSRVVDGYMDYTQSDSWKNSTLSLYNTDILIKSNIDFEYWLTGVEYTIISMA